MSRSLEIRGNKYDRLTVCDEAGKSKNGSKLWLCSCECGGTTVTTASSLKAGLVRSCGCLYKESRKDCNKQHGMSGTREYNSWSAMKQRCYNPESEYYDCYGGRGISVCDEWMVSFAKFYEDMGCCPEGMSIERIDVNGSYCKENCKWDTPSNQGYNTRMHSNNTSTKTGVHWHKATCKWAASIRANGKSIHLGVFENFEDAVKARKAAEIKYYGRNKK